MTGPAFRRWAALALLAVLVVAFGAAGWAVQEGKPTLDSGALNATDVVKSRLTVEALPLMAELGLRREDFNFGRALAYEDWVLFVPIQRVVVMDAFMQGDVNLVVAGFLYTRQPFEFLGQRYERGVHPILLLSQISIDVESSLKRGGRKPPQKEEPNKKVNITIKNNECNNVNICVLVGPTPPIAPPPGGDNPACVALGALAIGLSVAASPIPAVIAGGLALLTCL